MSKWACEITAALSVAHWFLWKETNIQISKKKKRTTFIMTFLHTSCLFGHPTVVFWVHKWDDLKVCRRSSVCVNSSLSSASLWHIPSRLAHKTCSGMYDPTVLKSSIFIHKGSWPLPKLKSFINLCWITNVNQHCQLSLYKNPKKCLAVNKL